MKQHRIQYNLDNKDKRAIYNKTYKESIIKKHKDKIICDCGLEITKFNLSRHKRSQKHINFINN